jgi:hypothetical protein
MLWAVANQRGSGHHGISACQQVSGHVGLAFDKQGQRGKREEYMAESKVGHELTNEILNTTTKSQAAVESIKPELPDASAPLAHKLPSPQEVVASAYDFAEQLLASQRKFAEDLLKATAPLLPAGPAGNEKKADK